MKTLILMRHAKSSWGNPNLPDRDRPLNKRGMRAAPLIGRWLVEHDLVPDHGFVSNARRTAETWQGLALDTPVTFSKALYHAGPHLMIEVIERSEDECVLLLGHNPGSAELASMLASDPPSHPRFDQFPTASVLVVDFDIANWRDLPGRTGAARHFVTPHDLV